MFGGDFTTGMYFQTSGLAYDNSTLMDDAWTLG